MRKALLTVALLVGVVGPIAAAIGGNLGDDSLWPLSWLAWAPVGYIILLRRSGNGVGAAALTVGATMGASFLALTGAVSEQLVLEARAWIELFNVVLGVVPWLAIVWLVLVFPSGTLRGAGERWVGRLTVVLGVIASTAFIVDPQPMFETEAPSPLAVPALGSLAALITVGPGFMLVVALLLAGLVLLVRRMRRSVGMERAQFRWLLFGVACFVFVVTISQFLPDDSPGRFLFFPGGFAIPVTIGIAVSRYRLYEIDRLMSRTITYGSVLALLGLLVLGLVGLFANFLPSDDPLVVAVSTLAAAALFNPVRRRVQTFVDRRFNRAKYDAEQVMEDFSGSLREGVDADRVVEGWVEVIEETMQPASVGVWVKR